MYYNNFSSIQRVVQPLNHYVYFSGCFSVCIVLLQHVDLAHLSDEACLFAAGQVLAFNCTCCDESEMYFAKY